MKNINIPFSIGQIVYLKTDEDQNKNIVTGIIIKSTGILLQIFHNGFELTVHDFEITANENVLVKLGITSEK